jgi:hypothetical protein
VDEAEVLQPLQHEQQQQQQQQQQAVDVNVNAVETEDLQPLQEEQEQQQQQQPEVKEMWTCPIDVRWTMMYKLLDAFVMKMGRKQGVYRRDFEVLI